MSEVSSREWLAFHFFYHQDRGLLLRELILPLAAEACRSCAERFFYLLYNLGGPHIRLRLELPGGTDPAEIEALIAERSAAFFALFPSTDSRSAEQISTLNRQILASDPNESDDRVLPDNYWERAVFRPEMARYGGHPLLDPTYDLFMASSLAAGELLKSSAGLKDTLVFPKKMILLGKLAVALAKEESELESLLSYPLRWWPALEPLASRAEHRFVADQGLYLELWRRALRTADDEAPAIRHLQATARRLRQRLEEVGQQKKDLELRAPYLLASHIHMTANRLELGNANEVLAMALLARAHQLNGPTPACEIDVRKEDRDLALAALMPTSMAEQGTVGRAPE